MKQKAQRTKPEPPKLEELIERTNLLPAWFRPTKLQRPESGDPAELHLALYRVLQGLVDWADGVAEENEGRRKKPEKDLDNIQERVERLKGYVLGGFDLKPSFNLTAKTRNFDMTEYMDSLYDAAERYEDFVVSSTQLRLVALQSDIVRLNKESGNAIPIPEADTIPAIGGVRLKVGKDGILRLQVAEFLHALEGVEFDRIGVCDVCERIFWVGRKGVVCCSHACTNVRNNRILRGKYHADSVKYKFRKMDEERKRKKRKKAH